MARKQLDFFSYFDSSGVVLVKPNSPKTEFIGLVNGILKIALKAHPENGKANVELVKFLKKQLKKDVKIISGFTSKKKIVRIL